METSNPLYNRENYPGVTGETADVAMMVGAALVNAGPLPIGLPKYNIRKHTIYHFVAVAAGLTYTFFNVAATPGVTNMKQAGQLQTENVFWCTKLGFRPVYDSTANNTFTVAQLEGIRQVVDNPDVNFKVGDRTIVDQIRGLFNFPIGGGLDAGLAVGVPAAAGAASYVGPINNGVAHMSNKGDFVPFAILPQKNISVTVAYPAAVNANLAGFTNFGLLCQLEGILISPANF